MALVIRNGQVVTPVGVRSADVACGEDGTIHRIGSLTPAAGDDVVDADGCYVLPGGVDPHCHLMSGLSQSSRAAALGGTTTALSFSLPDDDDSTLSAFLRARGKVEAGESLIDIGLHAMCYRPETLTEAELTRLAEVGADAVKIFLAYPELGIMATGGGLHRVMRAAARVGLPVQVHCEDGELVDALVEQATPVARRGRFEPTMFAQVRPPALEEVAVNRALATAALAGARVYITHVSTTGALAHIRRARRAGRTDIHAEACLHHVLLDSDEYRAPAGGDLLVAPPLRPHEHVAALQEALLDGTIDTLGSDHSQQRTPVDERICPAGEAGYGIAGIGARLPLLLSWGLEHGVAIERLAYVLATGPAEAFGYAPRKGTVSVGGDADLVVWDPRPVWTVGADSFDDGTGTSPYRGRHVRGRVRSVFLRGRALVREGELLHPQRPGRIVAPASRSTRER